MTNYSYFSGANVTIKLNNNHTLECAGISFNLSNSAQPAYGYASQEFDMVLPGRKLLQGSFVVNYTEANYLSGIISSIRGDTVEDITDRNELFDISIEYGRSNLKRDLLLKNCYLISRGQTIQISEQVILEEFSFIGQAVRNDNPSRGAQQLKPVLKAKPKIQPNPTNKKTQTKQNTKVEAEILILFDNTVSLDKNLQIDATLFDNTKSRLIGAIEEISKDARFNLSFVFVNDVNSINFIEGSNVKQASIKLINDRIQVGRSGNVNLTMIELEEFLIGSKEEKPSTLNKEYILFYIAGDDAVYNEANLSHIRNIHNYPWKEDGKVLIKVSENGKCTNSNHQNLGVNSTFDDSFKETMGWLVTCAGVGDQFEKNNIKESILTYLDVRFAD